jgi:GNAT superfamily N-acetyltransferase
MTHRLTADSLTMPHSFYGLLDRKRDLGLLTGVWTFFRSFFRAEYLVLLRDLNQPGLPLKTQTPYRLEYLTEQHIRHVPALNPSMSLARVRQRLNQGERCLLCWRGETLVHYQWQAYTTVYLPYHGRSFRLLEGDMLSNGVYTSPELRGQGLFSTVWALALEEARKRGFRRYITLVPPWHSGALRVAFRSGMETVGSISFWKLGPYWTVRYTTKGAIEINRQGEIYVSKEERSCNERSIRDNDRAHNTD